MSNIYTKSELRTLLKPVFTSYGVKRAILFGSYAKGAATEKSDVDLLVDSGLRGLRFVALCEDVRRALNCEVDMFDVAHITENSLIEKEISESGVVIHEE